MLDGSKIKERRERSELSQERLGRLIGQDGQYVSKLERGIRQNITTDTLEQLATVLDCSTDYLLGRTDEPRLQRPRRRTTTAVG
jgi:transcriptional regulator with XRE-family HTH domain